MTWTKLGDEWPDAARDLPDGAFRLHVEALCWSNRRGLDLTIPKRDLRRFADGDDPSAAAAALVVAGWWQDCSDAWFIGVQYADWQLESQVIAKRREGTALRVRRHRLHEVGDHSNCLPKNCRNALPPALRNASPGTGRDGTGRAARTGSPAELDDDGDCPGPPSGTPIPDVPVHNDGLTEQERAVRACAERVRQRGV